MKFVVVGHHSRREKAEVLAKFFDAHLLIDEGNHGATWNHRRALEWAVLQDERVIVLEDDALPVEGFELRAREWFARYPMALLSFYLGTSRPPQWQKVVDVRLKEAIANGNDTISLDQLIHGVCYSIPSVAIQRILNTMNPRAPADFSIGKAWAANVIYPIFSLVQHEDGIPVDKHPDGESRDQPRVARFLASTLVDMAWLRK